MKDLAKSSGILLQDHVRHLEWEAEQYFKQRKFVVEKYKRLTDGGNLVNEVLTSIHWHDIGKRHGFWQTACKQDHEDLKRCAERLEFYCERCQSAHETWHAKTKFRGKHIIDAGSKMRHEIASLEILHCKSPDALLTVKAAIAAHHGKLSERHRDRCWLTKRFPEFEKHWDEFFNEKFFDLEGEAAFEAAIHKRYCFAGVRALLQLCDHRASAFEDNEVLPPIEGFAYNFPHKDANGNPSYRDVQKEVKNLWDEPFAILRAPTGAGKTDAALLWAQHQIEQGRADRLVIAMPTRFTANALAISSAENLSATGLYHSSALYQRTKDLYESQEADGEDIDALRYECLRDGFTLREIERFIDKEQELARKLETPVTVTTIDHLCIALTGTREDHHAIFFSLAHSCLVIDEADFYDEFTQQNIVTLLKALRVLDVRVLLMSATVPESAREVYAESGMRAVKIHEDRTDYERPRCHLTRFRHPVLKPDDFQELLQRPLNGEPTIIYVNTVGRAQEIYRWLKQRLQESAGKAELKLNDVMLYHSRFTEPHKVEKEAKLLRLLGREAWRDGKAIGVAILTQIGEISVNISADLMISELCPIDRLAQRAGRLSRFKERADGRKEVKGELFVIEPHRLNKRTGELEFHPAPYGHYANGWEMTDALRKSIELLTDGDYSAERFIGLTNQLYPAPPKLASHVCDNMRALENCAVLNWLIQPCEEVENEDDETKDWRSRDIPFQSTVYANFKRDNGLGDDFDRIPQTRAERRRFELRHGVKCYAYQFKYAHNKNLLDKMTIEIHGDTETVWLVRESYSRKLGLCFKDDDSEEE